MWPCVLLEFELNFSLFCRKMSKISIYVDEAYSNIIGIFEILGKSRNFDQKSRFSLKFEHFWPHIDIVVKNRSFG